MKACRQPENGQQAIQHACEPPQTKRESGQDRAPVSTQISCCEAPVTLWMAAQSCFRFISAPQSRECRRRLKNVIFRRFDALLSSGTALTVSMCSICRKPTGLGLVGVMQSLSRFCSFKTNAVSWHPNDRMRSMGEGRFTKSASNRRNTALVSRH